MLLTFPLLFFLSSCLSCNLANVSHFGPFPLGFTTHTPLDDLPTSLLLVIIFSANHVMNHSFVSFCLFSPSVYLLPFFFIIRVSPIHRENEKYGHVKKIPFSVAFSWIPYIYVLIYDICFSLSDLLHPL